MNGEPHPEVVNRQRKVLRWMEVQGFDGFIEALPIGCEFGRYGESFDPFPCALPFGRAQCKKQISFSLLDAQIRIDLPNDSNGHSVCNIPMPNETRAFLMFTRDDFPTPKKISQQCNTGLIDTRDAKPFAESRTNAPSFCGVLLDSQTAFTINESREIGKHSFPFHFKPHRECIAIVQRRDATCKLLA
jgi:hypothetical protein